MIIDLVYEFTPWASMSKLSERRVSFTKSKSEKDTEAAWDSLSLGEKLAKTYSILEDNDGKFSLGEYDIGDVVFEGYIFDRDPFVLSFRSVR